MTHPSSNAHADTRDPAHDFDFVHGSWTIKNRRLDLPLSGSHDWHEFDATSTSRPIWGGTGNVEEWDGTAPAGRIQGLAVRLFDPATRRWSITWANRNHGTLDTPVVGIFQDGRGEFFGDSTFDGRPIRERWVWSEITGDAARWEQAYSTDGGVTWETNWIMRFTRASAR